MNRLATAVRVIAVSVAIAVLAFGAYLLVSTLGSPAVTEWAKYVSWFFVFEGTLIVALIARTYDLQNLEPLSPDQRSRVRRTVKRRVDGLWALFAVNVAGGLSVLATMLLKETAYASVAATLLLFFVTVCTILLVTLPAWYHQIEGFKSYVIEDERTKKARAEVLKAMRQAADSGYKSDARLDQYSNVVEPNSHA